MHFTSSVLIGASILGMTTAFNLAVRDTTCTCVCPSAIIDTRGTSEQQGPSAGFITMNQNIMSQLPNGKIYNTVYPAAANQDSSAGTADIINHIQTTLQSSPNECFILEGYSQGAAATVNALVQLTGTSNTAVKGVFLIGDPLHKAGLSCNVDSNGGTTTRNLNGISEYYGSNSITSGFVSRSLDVCDPGDGVCTNNGEGIDAEHLSYPNDANVQNMGTKFVVDQLTGVTYTHQ
ncbi:cutinase [Aureobasidium sp. EXF-3400]|nr:cutinase [Aureobasidium sp. EXF-12344]KAI4771213.1 cutinase [Aureobasidium sp. EXF-3400]